ncbi:hypothetical protein JW905_18225, partial [bacterium]|nr:hypothetical protein [candidate division CSSED10-310 bacterium]
MRKFLSTSSSSSTALVLMLVLILWNTPAALQAAPPARATATATPPSTAAPSTTTPVTPSPAPSSTMALPTSTPDPNLCPGVRIGALPCELSGSTAGATNEYDPGVGGCASGFPQPGPDVAFSLPITATGLVRLSVIPAAAGGFDPSVYVVLDCGNVAASCVGGADQGLTGEPEQLEVVLFQDLTYFILVDSWSMASSGAFELSGEYLWFATVTPTPTLSPTPTFSPTATLSPTPTERLTATPWLSPTAAPSATRVIDTPLPTATTAP